MVRAKHYYVGSVINEMKGSRFEAVALEDILEANFLVDDLVQLHNMITPGSSIIHGKINEKLIRDMGNDNTIAIYR